MKQMLVEGIHLFWMMFLGGPELKKGKGTQSWSVGDNNTCCCQAWWRLKSSVYSFYILGKPQISAVWSLFFAYNCLKLQLVQFCFTDTEIVNNSMKRKKKRYPGSVAWTWEHFFEVGKTRIRGRSNTAAVCPAGETDAGLYHCMLRLDGVLIQPYICLALAGQQMTGLNYELRLVNIISKVFCSLSMQW